MTHPESAPGRSPRRHAGVPPRALARDLSKGLVGEIMDIRDTTHGPRYDLRPVGGGCEWTALAKDVQLLDGEAAS